MQPNAEDRWNPYVSLKFQGPGYGGNAKKDEVRIDCIILVKPATENKGGEYIRCRTTAKAFCTNNN